MPTTIDEDSDSKNEGSSRENGSQSHDEDGDEDQSRFSDVTPNGTNEGAPTDTILQDEGKTGCRTQTDKAEHLKEDNEEEEEAERSTRKFIFVLESCTTCTNTKFIDILIHFRQQ